MLPGYPDRRPWQASQEHAARRKRTRRLSSSLYTAWLCGVLPIVVGVSVFVAWVITRQTWLMAAGLWTILAGTLLCVLGLAELALFYFRAMPRAPRPRRVRRVSLASLAFLLSGFPLALGLIFAVIRIETTFKITVVNTAHAPLEAARLFGGGRDELLGTIEPGQQVRRYLNFSTDGNLAFEAQLSNQPVQVTVEGYVTGSIGGEATVTVNSDGQAEVTRPIRN